MKRLCILLAATGFACAHATAANPDAPRWEQQAANVTIVRDDWGIPHVHGKTDADAVFGMIYAQAEDDFNRVETNYINAMGRLGEAEGESAIYRDLRMKLFINPDSLKAEYATSPEWLKTLMVAWADGLNFYLYKHPAVKPRVITHFEPWMALSFSEGSIGGDIENVKIPALQSFYGDSSASRTFASTPFRFPEPSGSNGMAIAPSNTADHHALLLINPHTSFYFRAELQMTSDEGLECIWRIHVGTILRLSGIQQARRLDAHDERRRRGGRVRGDHREEGRQPLLQVWLRASAGDGGHDRDPRIAPPRAPRRRRSPSIARCTGRSCDPIAASGSVCA